jgi:hypothetical protein
MEAITRLDAPTADRLARLILPSLHREYPNKIAHVLDSDADVRAPRELTPLFFGSFDWHSSVHSHWSIARLLRLVPHAAWADQARQALDDGTLGQIIPPSVVLVVLANQLGVSVGDLFVGSATWASPCGASSWSRTTRPRAWPWTCARPPCAASRPTAACANAATWPTALLSVATK